MHHLKNRHKVHSTSEKMHTVVCKSSLYHCIIFNYQIEHLLAPVLDLIFLK